MKPTKTKVKCRILRTVNGTYVGETGTHILYTTRWVRRTPECLDIESVKMRLVDWLKQERRKKEFEEKAGVVKEWTTTI